MSRAPRSSGTIALGLLGVLALILLVSQLVIPPLIESRIDSRLTEKGGKAEVEIDAMPALGMIFGSAQRLYIDGSGLTLEESDRDSAEALDRLDSFDEVDIAIAGSLAGPVELERFELRRPSPDDHYDLIASGTTTAADLADYGAERFGLAPPFLDQITSVLEAGRSEIPIELALEVISRDGRLAVSKGEATIGGVPTGPVVELVLAAIVARI